MIAIESPTPLFLDKDSSPLDGGMLYFGLVNQNPETNPITVYWDTALTQPAVQPIRTLNGVIVRSGTAASLYSNSDYSLTIRDKHGRFVYSSANSNQYSLSSAIAAVAAALAAFAAALLSGAGATLISFFAKGSAFARLLQDKLRDSASPADYPGGDNTGATFSDAAITAALANNARVDLGDGTNTWKISQTILVAAGKSLISDGANIVVAADVPAVRLLGQSSRVAGPKISWSVANTAASNGVEVGDVANNARESIVERVTVTGAGGHSFVGRHGNVCKLYANSSVSPKLDDYHWTTETIDCNNWNVIACDGNSAGNDGFHFEGAVSVSNTFNPRAHTIIGGSIQSATRYGYYSNTPKNTALGIYIELSGNKDVYLDTFSFSTFIVLSEGSTFVNVPGVAGGNRILSQNPDASNRRIDLLKVYGSGASGSGFGLANNDGTAGECYWEKRGTRNFVFAAATSGATASTSFLNDAGGANQHVVIVGGNIYPATTNAFTCGQSGQAWSGGFTQVAFTITSDGNTKTEKRDYSDAELAAGLAIAKLPCFYKLKTSVTEKGTDAARWHSGMVAQDVAKCFTDQGLDPARYAMWCSDAVMVGIGEPLLDDQGRPMMEGGGDPLFDVKGQPLVNADGTPKLHPGFPMVDTVGKQLVVEGAPQVQFALRYDEAYALAIAAQERRMMLLEARISRLEAPEAVQGA